MIHPDPLSVPPGEPRPGYIWAVRYFDTGGRPVTALFRRSKPADRYAELIRARGGEPAVFRGCVSDWEPS